MTYKLTKTETGNKSARFHYVVTDEAGNIISERKSDRDYVACTINGQFYFGRLDLIGKGDHGKQLKQEDGYRWQRDRFGRYKMVFDPNRPKIEHTPIAYLSE